MLIELRVQQVDAFLDVHGNADREPVGQENKDNTQGKRAFMQQDITQ